MESNTKIDVAGACLRALKKVGPTINNACARMGKCPCCHTGGHSLIIAEHWDGLRVRCQNGCDPGAIFEALGVTQDERSEQPTVEVGRSSEGRVIKCTQPHYTECFPYVDASGKERYNVHRSNYADFWCGRLDDKGGGIHWIDSPCALFLFNLPAVIAANPDEPIFVVESEPDVEQLALECLVATCNPKGAGHWRSEYAEVLRDKHVVIIPNNDQSGFSHAAEVRGSLKGIAKSAVILELPGVLPHGSVSDWLDGGNTAAHLLELARMGEWIADGKPRRSRGEAAEDDQ